MICRSLFKKVFFISTFLLSCIALPAQVMWNLKGGLMPTAAHHVPSYKDSESRLNWMAGIEMEIPLSQKFNLETGLRYKNEALCYYHSHAHVDERHTENHLELPVRLAYKYKLGNNLSLRAGVGPYLGVAMGESLKVGIEPSVAVDWKCLSLGLTYNHPYYFESGKHKANSGLMLTVGFRFRSDKWKYVGAGLLAAGAVAGTVYAATQGDYSGSSYIPSSSSYPGSSVSSSSISSSNSDNSSSDAKYYLREYQRFENLAKDHFNTLTNLGGYKVKKNGKDVSGSNLQSLSQSTFLKVNNSLIKAQAEMRKIRTEAANKGINIPKSEYEDVKVKW